MTFDQYFARVSEYLPADTVAHFMSEMMAFHREGCSVNGFVAHVYGTDYRTVPHEIYKTDLCDEMENVLNAIDVADAEYLKEHS